MVGFIGDNSHCTLPKNKISKFMKNLNTFSRTRKKKLLNSINLAKSLMEEKGRSGNAEEKHKENKMEMISPLIRKPGRKKMTILKKKRVLRKKIKKIDISEENSSSECEEKLMKKSISKMNSSNSFYSPLDFEFKKRRKKVETVKKEDNKQEITDLMKTVISYLYHIVKQTQGLNEKLSLCKEKENVLKMLNYLMTLKMENPINYLRRTNLGIIVKAINSNFQDTDVKEMSQKVNKFLEEQVLTQIFESKK